MNIEHIFSRVKAAFNWSFDLKKEQMEILSLILNRQNVFAILPTGYGKSLLYTMAPLLLDEVAPEDGPHIALVISPLRALMKDQLERCKSMGIKATILTKRDEMTDEDVQLIENGQCSVIISSPEALTNGPWMSAMRSFRNRVSLIAFDEAHCLSEWGSEFRPEYQKAVSVRSLFNRASFLGLTATVTEKMLSDIHSRLELHQSDVTVKAFPPDRPNIYLKIVHQKSYDIDRDLKFVADDVRAHQKSCPKYIVFAQTIHQVADIYEFLMDELGTHAFENGDCNPVKKFVSMYHGQLTDTMQCYTLSEYRKANSTIRVLISTIAFGLGIDIPDIRHVIHWGKSKSVLSHWQEVGRCSRDGNEGVATWFPQSTAGDDKEVFDKLKRDVTTCIRLAFLNAFVIPGMDTSSIETLKARQLCPRKTICQSCLCSFCVCCVHCRMLCKCYTA